MFQWNVFFIYRHIYIYIKFIINLCSSSLTITNDECSSEYQVSIVIASTEWREQTGHLTA